MMKVLMGMALILISLGAFAQRGCSIKGSVADTLSGLKLANTTVCVLNAKDSILRKFVYAGESGSFFISGLEKGKYILLASYTNYADYSENFTLDNTNPIHDFGSIVMRLKSNVLQEVIIKGKMIPVRIKGDTTEFNAEAYVVQPNDKVEDLLKQMPGIEVNKDGRITANGQNVTKILVDGEEFFRDDPTLVTRNIRADMVDKVQLYDKKSDQAAFTRIDDGKKIKTINVILKEEKRTGEFGKITAGLGSNDFYSGEAFYNKFAGDKKIAAHINLSNVGNMLSGSGGNDGSDFYGGQGKPLTRNGGLHYNGKVAGDKADLDFNYQITSNEVDGNSAATSLQVIENDNGGVLNMTSNQAFRNSFFLQKLDGSYTSALNSSSNVKINFDGLNKHSTVDDIYQTSVFGKDENRINDQRRDIINISNQQIFNISAFYAKKFKKNYRAFSWTMGESYNKIETKGQLKSLTDFYNNSGVTDSSQIINQHKISRANVFVYNSSMTYSEPVFRTLSMVFNYGFSVQTSRQDNESFDQSFTGAYDKLNTAYSNDYRLYQFNNQLGTFFNYQKEKITFNIGAKASKVSFNQDNISSEMSYHRVFFNWYPQATFLFTKSNTENITLNYSGYTAQPTINQIQPVLVNTDPQNLIIGNTHLRSSFTNNVSFTYGAFKPASDSYLNFAGSFSSTVNQIINNTYTDPSTAKTITQYINLKNRTPYLYNVSLVRSLKLKKLDLMFAISLNLSGNVGYSFINNEINQSKQYTYSLSTNFIKYRSRKYSMNLRFGPSYNLYQFSLDPGGNNNAVGFNGDGSSSYFFPGKFFFTTNLSYTYTAKTRAFLAQYKTIWNASISKTFSKDDRLRLTLSANDLLNQNVLFNHSLTANQITQSNISGVKRYFILSIGWDFNKFETEPKRK
jgi:hypothetical protein